MGCCCVAPKIENSNNEENKNQSNKNGEKSFENMRNFSIFSKKSKVDAQSNYSSNYYKYSEEEEEENVFFLPKYDNFEVFFEKEKEISLQGYCFIQFLGRGDVSSVYKVEKKGTGQFFAAKVYHCSKDNFSIKYIQNEVELMNKMSNLYVLKILDEFHISDPLSFIAIIPYAEYGNVQSLLINKVLSDIHIIICFHQIAIALRYMHSINIVHGDIKPDNILCFSSSYFVLSDFDKSDQLENDSELSEDLKGSPFFLSPEIIKSEGHYPKPVDVWAFGVSFYYAIFGFYPYNLIKAIDNLKGEKSISNALINILQLFETEKLTFPKRTANNNPVDIEIIRLLKNLLNKDPRKRPSFEQIVNCKCFQLAWPIHEANLASLDD